MPTLAASNSRQRAAAITSLATSAVLLGVKLAAWLLTGSAAVLSDTLESVVNVVAAGFAVYSISLAHKPADADHPYGHGKVEFLSAGFEGGLIFLAGGLIIWESIARWIRGAELTHIAGGLWLVGGAAGVNLVLALVLLRVGKKSGSLTLVADGMHVMSDVLTSAFAMGGLGLVLVTGAVWIDPLVAIVSALNILRMGVQLVRHAVGGIMDEADPADLAKIEATLMAIGTPGLVRWGSIRSRHQGQLHHVDVTLWVDPSLSMQSADALVRTVEAEVSAALGRAEVLCQLRPETPAPAAPQGQSARAR